jgi:hypothetical protein
MGRQVGSAIGIAILVAVLDAMTSAADFHRAWLVAVIAGIGSGALLAGLGPHRQLAAAPAPALGSSTPELT